MKWFRQMWKDKVGRACLIVILGNAIDVGGTVYVLGQGAKELNPVMESVLASGVAGVLVKLIFVTATAVGMFLIAKAGTTRFAGVGLRGLAVVYTLVAIFHVINISLWVTS